MKSLSRIAIVGGGPGGLMLARLLQCRGLTATVYERDTSPAERPQGGSLDLHADTGQRALREAGLHAEFLAAARPEDQGDRLYDQDGRLLFDRNGAGDDRPEIDRSALRQILLDAVMPGTVRWGSRVRKVEPVDVGVRIHVNTAAEDFDIVVGADGAWSRIRPLLTVVRPAYEGVAMVELGFTTAEHPAVDALVGGGKMFAVGDNRVLIAQRNGRGHIRGYAGLRMTESAARALAESSPAVICSDLRGAFDGWSPSLTHLVGCGNILGVRPLYALPGGYRWPSQPGLTLLGDAAHVMSPFSGEGVNLALADAADLAEALSGDDGWATVESYEAAMMARASIAALGAAAGLEAVLSSAGSTAVLQHYRERAAA